MRRQESRRSGLRPFRPERHDYCGALRMRWEQADRCAACAIMSRDRVPPFRGSIERRSQSQTAVVILTSRFNISVSRLGFESALGMHSDGLMTCVMRGSCSSRTISAAVFPAGADAPLATKILPTHLLQSSPTLFPSTYPGSSVMTIDSEALCTLTPL